MIINTRTSHTLDGGYLFMPVDTASFVLAGGRDSKGIGHGILVDGSGRVQCAPPPPAPGPDLTLFFIGGLIGVMAARLGTKHLGRKP